MSGPASKTIRQARLIATRWRRMGGLNPRFRARSRALREAVALLSGIAPKRPHPLSLPEQPFDSLLLNVSPLYRRSRELFLKEGGRFRATLVSSPRTLSAVTLLESLIEYSPIERELVWSATDPAEKRNEDHLLALRTFCSSLFHEQNHRTLWNHLLPSAKDRDSIRRYLNFAESLVITLDAALGDELGPELASMFHLIGVTYDPGTQVKSELKTRRDYRNYLQASLHSTYLNLEHYDPKEIPRAIRALFPNLGDFADRAAERALNLDSKFVLQTNPLWQKKHRQAVARFVTGRRNGEPLALPASPPLALPASPMDNRFEYLFGEKLFEWMGL